MTLSLTFYNNSLAVFQSIYLGTMLNFLPFAGKVLKYALLLLLALNARSFPGMWHIRLLFRSQWVFYFKKYLNRNDKKYLERISPVGKSPFELMHIMQGVATLDDSDMFGHLSNSSYAKTLDIARMQSGVQFWPSWYTTHRGVTPLAGADYSFIKEIPILARYEMRTAIGGWDHKWLYFVHYFVTYPKKGSRKASEKDSETLVPPSPLPRDLLPPGATLHSVSVSRLCFKQGRLTTPPTIVLALSGMGGTEAIGRARWARKMQLAQEGRIREVMTSKELWKEELARPFQEGGWELTEFEDERKAGIEMCGKLLSGLEELRPVAEQ